MKNSPKASLIMPNYNYGHYLKEALNSIVNQTYQNFELILIDDASTDNSISIIEPYLKKFDFIHFIKHKKNMGMFKSFQEGLDQARGNYISFIASDDLFFPPFLEKKVAALEKNPNTGLCFSLAATFTKDPRKDLISSTLCKSIKEGPLSRHELIQLIKMKRLWIPGNTTLCRKELFKEAGGYLSKFESLTDWFQFHKIAFKYGAYYIPETLGALRTHESSFSTREKTHAKVQAWSNILDELSKKESKDTRNAFVRSHIFNTQGLPFFEFILKNPKYWLLFKQQVWNHFYPKVRKQKQATNKT